MSYTVIYKHQYQQHDRLNKTETKLFDSQCSTVVFSLQLILKLLSQLQYTK